MKSLSDTIIDCSVVGKVIVLPKDMGYDDNLFKTLKMIMTEKGGVYYPSEKYRGFVFRNVENATETQALLDYFIDKYSESKNILAKYNT